MSNHPSFHELLRLLEQLGVPLHTSSRTAEDAFPLPIPLKDGKRLTLSLDAPSLVGLLDPDEVGVAYIDSKGTPVRTWGLARRSLFLRPRTTIFSTELGGLVLSAFEGSTSVMYHEGLRYHAAAVPVGDELEVFILVTNAHEEKHARKEAASSARAASALKRLGKALNMNQKMQELCVAAVHELVSGSELAAALLWTLDREIEGLSLTASVGINRTGSHTLNRLTVGGEFSCAAELVAGSRQPFYLNSVYEHIMTADLEAQICYLKPGGVFVHPLVISDALIGVLELIGREGDVEFGAQQELFATCAEHLALALNSAMMFENFEKLAHNDALTGIANHRSMQEFLQRRLAEAQRSGQPLGVLMLDVDHFRAFNEEEGHDAGDDVLRLVAETLKDMVRPYDLAARYGGEEFTVVLPGSGVEATTAAAERIRQKVESLPFVTRTGRERHVTVSIGCAGFPDTGKEAATLLKAADIALFEVKRSGRNGVAFYKGEYVPGVAEKELGLDGVWQWVPESERTETEALLQFLKPQIGTLAKALRLSKAQKEMLEALVVISRTYRTARADGHEKLLAAMEAAEEFRLLLPSLHAMEERFDGKGPAKVQGGRIPLLARVLNVLLAVAEHRGEPLVEDPGRFDPEVVSLVVELDVAA